MRIEDKDIPEAAVAVFAAEMRRCDSLGLVSEERVACRLPFGPSTSDRYSRAPGFEYRALGGSTGWWEPKPEINYPGVPGYLEEFFVAGLVEHTTVLRSGDWAVIHLTQAGEFLFSVWRRDRDRRNAAHYAEQDRLDAEADLS